MFIKCKSQNIEIFRYYAVSLLDKAYGCQVK